MEGTLNKLNTVVIALGSNLNNPQCQIQKAIQAISAIDELMLLRMSSLYQTKPVGYANQPDFINAVMILQTSLSADNLLKRTQELEIDFGRERTFLNAPRTLDLDIIDYAGVSQASVSLTLPHPRAAERLFVLIPWLEIDPDAVLTGHGRVQELVQQLKKQLPESDLPIKLPIVLSNKQNDGEE